MYLHLSIKLLAGFIILFIATKFIGGRELRQLNVFDFISAIVLSELVGNVLFQKDIHVLNMVYAVFFWTAMIYLIDKITIKSPRARHFLDGEPDLVIEGSNIDKRILGKHEMDLNELLGLLREKDIFTVREVEYAFIEPDGQLSVIKKKFEGISEEKPVLPRALILDGEIAKDTLDRMGKDDGWLQNEIAKQGFSSPKQVFYGEFIEGCEWLLQRQPTQDKSGP
jgi:uncharacterized membrane protein YcaP (DUF421 family)